MRSLIQGLQFQHTKGCSENLSLGTFYTAGRKTRVGWKKIRNQQLYTETVAPKLLQNVNMKKYALSNVVVQSRGNFLILIRRISIFQGQNYHKAYYLFLIFLPCVTSVKYGNRHRLDLTVCPSVCLSRIISTNTDLWSFGFHQTVAPCVSPVENSKGSS